MSRARPGAVCARLCKAAADAACAAPRTSGRSNTSASASCRMMLPAATPAATAAAESPGLMVPNTRPGPPVGILTSSSISDGSIAGWRG